MGGQGESWLMKMVQENMLKSIGKKLALEGRMKIWVRWGKWEFFLGLIKLIEPTLFTCLSKNQPLWLEAWNV